MFKNKKIQTIADFIDKYGPINRLFDTITNLIPQDEKTREELKIAVTKAIIKLLSEYADGKSF